MNPTVDNSAAASLARFIRSEDGPALGSGTLPVADDQLYVGLAHLFAIVIWPWKKGASPAVDAHGKEALNMAITCCIAILTLKIATAILPGFLGTILSLASSLLGLAFLALATYGALQAHEGKLLRYPFNLRLIK
jgi:uncharacterized Tic20 family protein